MTLYRCPTCDQSANLPTIPRGITVPCPTANCNQNLTNKNRDYQDDLNPPLPLIGARRPRKILRVSAPGRSSSAPPPPNLTSWPRPTMPQGLSYCASLFDPVWTGMGQTDIGFAYNKLDLAVGGMQGLVLSFADANRDAEVRAHFDACTAFMVRNHKTTDATEATGEIAAAMGMLSRHPGYAMLWGFHKHSGAGIDQIWWNQDQTHPRYLVVEAKGPGQTLSTNPFWPTGYGQMEEDWVVDRLARMRSGAGQTLANRIIGELGIAIHTAVPNYLGSSTSYYGATMGVQGPARLSGVTIAARWLPSGKPSYRVVSTHQYSFS